MVITGTDADTLNGTLTLSTCSNVCLLTDYTLRLDFNTPVDEAFQRAFDSAMRAIPGIREYPQTCLPGCLTVIW
jgi:suppressor for copper-sensitivity B